MRTMAKTSHNPEPIAHADRAADFQSIAAKGEGIAGASADAGAEPPEGETGVGRKRPGGSSKPASWISLSSGGSFPSDGNNAASSTVCDTSLGITSAVAEPPSQSSTGRLNKGGVTNLRSTSNQSPCTRAGRRQK